MAGTSIEEGAWLVRLLGLLPGLVLASPDGPSDAGGLRVDWPACDPAHLVDLVQAAEATLQRVQAGLGAMGQLMQQASGSQAWDAREAEQVFEFAALGHAHGAADLSALGIQELTGDLGGLLVELAGLAQFCVDLARLGREQTEDYTGENGLGEHGQDGASQQPGGSDGPT